MKFLRVSLLVAFFLLLLEASSCLALEERLEKAFYLSGPGQLSISTMVGNISIGAHEENTVQMVVAKKLEGLPVDEAKPVLEAIKIKTEQIGNQIIIKSEYFIPSITKFWFDLKGFLTSNRKSDLQIDYHLLVPKKTEITFSTWSGEVNIRKIQGRCKGKTVSGSVVLEGAEEEIFISTVSGKLEISGQGKLFLKSVSGEVWVEVPKSEQKQNLNISTVSGEVTVIFPENASIDLSIKTISGKFSSELPILLDKEERVPGKRFRGKIEGNTQQTIKCTIETVSGNIYLRKKEEVTYL